MKKMTCKQLGGACDHVFHAETFEEIAEMSKEHGMEMFKKGDQAHIKAMEKMQQLMIKPEEMVKWFEKKRQEFEELDDE